MKKLTVTDIIRQATIASIYIVLVFIFQFMSFEAIQFRIAELLVILIFFDKKSIIGILIGVFFSNLFSPLGIYDLIFGVLASLIALLLMLLFKKKPFIALIFPSIINGLVIGTMLHYLTNAPLLATIGFVFLGEFVVTYILGLPIYYILKNNEFEKIYFSEKNKDLN